MIVYQDVLLFISFNVTINLHKNLAKVFNINIPESLKVYDDKYTYLLRMLNQADLTATFDVALIDEVQDLNQLEWAIIKKITKRIISLGDFDQAFMKQD